MPTMIVVKAVYDPEAGVWFVEHSDLAGLNLEAVSVEALREKLPGAVADLLEAQGHEGAFDVPIEIIAHASTRATGSAIAA